MDWLTEEGLCILNEGTEFTCVRQNGASVVDVSFASPELISRVHDWEVLVDEETLSDHRYIRFRVSSSEAVIDERTMNSTDRRWTLKRMNIDVVLEAAIVQAWNAPPFNPVDLDEEVALLIEAMTHICDAAMPRVKALPNKRQVFWWSEEISELRRQCVVKRRCYQRLKRRRYREERDLEAFYIAYKEASKALRKAIADAKSQAWQRLLESLERDPWGRPYKIARQKLRPWIPPITSTLQPEILQRVVEGLFPESPRADFAPPGIVSNHNMDINDLDTPPEISQGELCAAILKMKAKNTAPGPDGIPGRVWALVQDSLEPRLRAVLDRCLREGKFPKRWKDGKLVLLRKEGRSAEEPAGYRPIVLLDEAGKLLERVIASRLVKHLDRVGPNLSETQFGFRRGRSTLDAIACVRDLSDKECSKGGVLLAVSLDIANAFNTLPWSTIKESLKYHAVPGYLQRLVGDYLSNREVVFPTKQGGGRSPMTRGVPQGSVLGPLLWNIGYDWVLRGTNLRGVSVVCYADDTLVTARGRNYREASILATAGVAAVVARIERLGLKVALHKSEAICFHGPRGAPPSGSKIIVGGTPINVGSTLRYLGVVLDSKWSFDAHMRQLSPKLVGTASALSCLLPNIGGGDGTCRRLYMAVIRSMALYGAPIWAESIERRDFAMLRKSQRIMAIRVCRGYRTLSHEVACVLAGSLPWDLEARILSAIYWRRVRARNQGQCPLPQEVVRWRRIARSEALDLWRERLLTETAQRGVGAKRVLEAVRPVLTEWVERKHGALTFRLTQVLTGHGCFGRYLCNVAKREPTPICHRCGCTEETAQHVLVLCPAEAEPRQSLVAVLGSDLSLGTILLKMVSEESAWEAMVSFSETVVSQRESDEREREQDPQCHPLRKARKRGRRAYVRTPSPFRGLGLSDVGASGTLPTGNTALHGVDALDVPGHRSSRIGGIIPSSDGSM